MGDQLDDERRFAAMERQIAIIEIQTASIIKRLDAIEDGQKWLFRLVAGAVILAVATFALKGGFVV